MDLSSKKISSSVNQRNTANQNSRSVGRMSAYGAKVPVRQLTEGQVIKGEITDLRNNEVSILLDDNTKVTGRLDQVNWLSIGDVAAFRVNEITPGKISLQAIPLSESTIENNTMFKALEEAGLPHNSRNQSIVLSLIQNQMPITKPSILNILKQSFELKEASISTIVLMNKYNIPATHENASQFENYRSSEHQLSSELNRCIDELPSMLRELALYSDDELGSKTAELFSVLDLGSAKENESSSNVLEQPFAFASEKAKNELLSILDDFDVSDEVLNSIKDGTISLKDLNQIIEECFQNAREIDERNQNEVLNSLSPEELADPAVTAKALAEVPQIVEAFDSSVIEQIQNAYEDALKDSQLTGGFFNQEGRKLLADFLTSGQAAPETVDRVLNGQAALTDTLLAIKQAAEHAPASQLQQLFQSDEFAFLLSNELSSQWKMHPEQLKKENGIKNFYQKLYNQAKGLTALMNSVNPDLNESEFGENLSSAKNNIDFMQMLNDIFPYVQIPFAANGLPGHAELYCYTKKKDLKKDPRNMSVLLHLSLEHLGQLDIHLTMNNLSLDAKFYIENGQSRRLMKKNIGILESKLRELGYSITTEFIKNEQKVDIVKDFIEQKESPEAIKRYTFDIRA